MKIFVKAKPFSKEVKVTKTDETHFVVAIKAPPTEGKANSAITKALALYFGKPPSYFRIIKGYSSRNKVIEILQ